MSGEVKKTTKTPDLKEIERKAFMFYHQDGLLDIFVGVYIIGFAAGILMDFLWDFSFGVIMPGILIAVVLPMWIAAKRKITMPRIGFVKFAPRGSSKLMAILIGLMGAGIGILFVFLFAQGERTQWIDFILQNGMLMVGVGSLIVTFLFGYTMGLKRLYGYGLLALILFVSGQFLGIFFAYIILALGLTTIATGAFMLTKFIRKYPVQGERAIAD